MAKKTGLWIFWDVTEYSGSCTSVLGVLGVGVFGASTNNKIPITCQSLLLPGPKTYDMIAQTSVCYMLRVGRLKAVTVYVPADCPSYQLFWTSESNKLRQNLEKLAYLRTLVSEHLPSSTRTVNVGLHVLDQPVVSSLSKRWLFDVAFGRFVPKLYTVLYNVNGAVQFADFS